MDKGSVVANFAITAADYLVQGYAINEKRLAQKQQECKSALELLKAYRTYGKTRRLP